MLEFHKALESGDYTEQVKLNTIEPEQLAKKLTISQQNRAIDK
jgi:hypothetical protein